MAWPIAGCGIVLALWLAGCAGQRSREGGVANMGPAENRIKVEPEARTLYYQAERNFLAKRYDAAMEGFRNVKARFPRGRAYMMASYRLATIYYYEGAYPEASREFEHFLGRYPQSDLTFDVTYNLAAAQFQQGALEKASQTLSRLRPSDIQAQGPRRAEVVYQLVAQVDSGLENHTGAVVAGAMMLQLPLEDSHRDRIEADVKDQLSRISEREKLERLLQEITEPTTRARITDRLASLSSVEAEQMAAAIPSASVPSSGSAAPIAAVPVSPGAAEASVEAGLGSSSSGDNLSIGVVLPLSGKSAPYGRKALEGILLASGVYNKKSPGNFRIFVEDTASNPAIAANAVEQLVNRQRVMAVIGPIGWKESIAVADKAQELGVPNLSLTGKEGISERGAYLFQNALTPGVQLENMVKFVINDRHYRRFAILAPKNAFGEDMANQFWDLVEQNGGKVVGFETYPPDEKDFQSYIRDLTGLSDPKDRGMEYGKLAQYVKEVKDKTGKEPKSPRIPPIVDFDGLFIPDSPKVVGQISASLAYFDVRGATLLGTTEWNSEQLYRRGGRYVEGALFPGGLSLGSRNPHQREFIRQYAEAYGQAPDLLASQAYEAMEVVGEAIHESGSSDRNSLVKEIAGLKDFAGPLGNLTFDNLRIARRAIPVFSLEPGGNIVEQ
jgi:ABC-type branched-subunit amino acid transport system substrate-binding protein/TolA-binding protein